MQPTVDAELAGVRRILEELASDTSLPRQATEAMRGASRSLLRVERHWSLILPYLVSDNGEVLGVLRDIAQYLPVALREDVDAFAEHCADAQAVPVPDFAWVNEVNERARELLSRAIAALPPGSPETSRPRARIQSYLLRSVGGRPW